MKNIPKLIFLLSIIFFSATASLAQAPPPKPAPSGTIFITPEKPPFESWQEFKHEPGNFAVMMPGKPLEMSQTVESQIGKVPMYSFTAQEGTLNYMAMYAEYPIALDTPQVAKSSLNGARDLMLNNRNGKLISETDVSFGKYPGRELKAKFDGGMIRLRSYVVNQRMYMLMVMAPGDDKSKQLESKKANDFLDSFKFLREPQPVEGDAPSMSRLGSEIDKLDLPPDFRARPVSWREVPSPEFGFTVWMPSEPFRKKIPLNPDDRRLDFNLWVARDEESLYQVIVQPMLAAPSSEEHRKIFFRSLIDGLLGSSGLKLESEKPISFEGHSGREYKLRGGPKAGTGRAYIIGSNVYFLLVLSDEKTVKSKEISAEIARFLDSFRLTKDPDAAPAVGAVSDGSASWREITEPGHGFKVLLPGEPKKESSSFQGVSTYNLISAGDGMVCVITRQRLSSRPDYHSASETFYKSFIDGFTKMSGIEIAGETKVFLDGHEGREYKLKKNDKTGVARVFLIGTDAYSVSAIAVLPGASAKSVSTFLDSFKLIEKSPKDEFAEPPPAPAPVRKDAINVSGGVLQASGIKKVEPDYPPIAKAAKAEGEVRIQITVSEEGKVIEAEVIEGHPLLRDAALQAARQWEFKPTELSGKPVKVQGVLTFTFSLK